MTMHMRIWIGLTLSSLVVVIGIIFLRSDMSGWPPLNWTNPAAIVEPIDGSDPPFAIGDCLPGTIDPFRTPDGRDYGGTATVHILTCRSRTSATKIALAYLLVILSYPTCRLIKRKRSR